MKQNMKTQKPIRNSYLCMILTCLLFCVTVATIVGTLVAFLLVPMRSLGADNWKIAAALMGSYIGGCECLSSINACRFWNVLMCRIIIVRI